MPDELQSAVEALQGTQATEQQVQAPAVVGDGPWAQDIKLIFGDDPSAAKVDEFFRTKIQPYVTRLEQDAAASREARELVKALNENPADTYVALTERIYGEQAANDLLTYMQQQLEAQDAAGQQQAAPDGQQASQPAPLDPRVEQAISFLEEQQNERLYDQAMQTIIAQNPDIAPDDLHGYVAQADGDFSVAVALYRREEAKWAAKYGAAPQQTQQAAPPVMGSGSGAAASSTTPVEKSYSKGMQGMYEAIDDMMADMRPSQAPPVV